MTKALTHQAKHSAILDAQKMLFAYTIRSEKRREKKRRRRKQTASLSRKPDSNDTGTSAAMTMALTHSLIKQSTLQVFRLLLARNNKIK